MQPGRIFDAYDAQVTVWGRANLDVADENIGLKGSPTVIAKASDKVAKGKGIMAAMKDRPYPSKKLSSRKRAFLFEIWKHSHISVNSSILIPRIEVHYGSGR